VNADNEAITVDALVTPDAEVIDTTAKVAGNKAQQLLDEGSDAVHNAIQVYGTIPVLGLLTEKKYLKNGSDDPKDVTEEGLRAIAMNKAKFMEAVEAKLENK